MKKYISPGSCFSLEYPDNWCEFEDSEDCFLFYNPDKWTGNFRISAYRGNSSAYANECLEDELHQVRGAKKVKVGSWDCVYSSESFQENGVWYTTHIWVTGRGEISVECSFTVAKGESIGCPLALIAGVVAAGAARPAVFQRPRRGDLLLRQHTGNLGRAVPGKAQTVYLLDYGRGFLVNDEVFVLVHEVAVHGFARNRLAAHAF